MLRKEFVALSSVLLLCFTVTTRSQESATPEPTATAKTRSVRLTFLPPPLDGTISLGIYDTKGKLVRVLHREVDVNAFNIGADALSTTWNGKTDSGEDAPAGKYRAHGFVVGDLSIQRTGFFFNDWVTAQDSPRISRIRSLTFRDDKLLLDVELVPHATGYVLYDIANKTVAISADSAPEATSSPTPTDGGTENAESIMTVAGRDGTRWMINRTAKGAMTTELKQFAASGELLRRLSSPADQPQPVAVAPSMVDDKVCLLEENATVQRLRGLTFIGTKSDQAQQAASDWKMDFEKSIIAHQNFSFSGGKPVVSSSSANRSVSVKVKLQPNPLLNDERSTVELTDGFDGDGGFLKTSDGLPLRTISKTPGLIRSLLATRGSSGVDLFQDDGAVVEQFRVTGVDQMMSFDCGGFELK